MTGQTHLSPYRTIHSLLAVVGHPSGSNCSAAAVRAYHTGVSLFLTCLDYFNMIARVPTRAERAGVTDTLASFVDRPVSGVSRNRKHASVREYFCFALVDGALVTSPVEGIVIPTRAPRGRTSLHLDERLRLSSLTGATSVMHPWARHGTAHGAAQRPCVGRTHRAVRSWLPSARPRGWTATKSAPASSGPQ